MNNSTIEKSLDRAIKEAPSLDFDYIAHAPIMKMTEHDYITMQPEQVAKNYYRQFTAAVSCCVVLLLFFTGWLFQYRMPDSIIYLDVNPSIKIVTNRREQVLSVTALNADAQKVLDHLNNKSSNLNNRVASIVTSIIQDGYMKIDKNVIMISVENKNSDKADTLVSSLNQIVKDSVLSQNITPLILKQTFQKDKNETELAEKYHISVGKLKLIQHIINSNRTYSIDILASRSMEDLLAISKENGVDLQKIIQFDDRKDDSSSTKKNHNTSQSRNDQIQGISNQTGNDRNGTDSYQSTDIQNEDKSGQSENDQNDNNSSQSGHDQGEDITPYSDNDQGENSSLQSNNNQGENKTSHSIINRNDNKSSQSDNDQGEYNLSRKSKSKSNSSKSGVDNNVSTSVSGTDSQNSFSSDNNYQEDSSLSNSDNTNENSQSSEYNQIETDSDVSKTDDGKTNFSSDTRWEDGNSSSVQESN